MAIFTERGRWANSTVDERGKRVFSTTVTERGQKVFGLSGGGTTYTGSGTASGVSFLSDTNAFITKGSGTESGISSITGNGGMLILAATGTTSGDSSLTTSETFYHAGITSYAATGTSIGLSSSIVNPVMLMVSGGTAQGISSAIGNATGSGWAKSIQPNTLWNKLNTPITNWTKGG